MSITAAFMLPHPPLIIPEIGKGSEGGIRRTIDAYHEAARRIGAAEPETIVLISPHQIMYTDYFHISPGKGAGGDFGRFRAGEVKTKVSYQYWKDYRLVRIGLSGLPLTKHYALGQCIRETADALGRKTVVIASGDLSHCLKEDGPYGYKEEGPVYDRHIMEVMGNADFGRLLEFPEDFCEKAGECGHRSFTIMAGALDETKVTAQKLSYEGPFGVGYGICCYTVCGADALRNFRTQYETKERMQIMERREKEDAFVKLARATIETYVSTGEIPDLPKDLPDEMYRQRAGAFVSIKENGSLRGCIGTIQATRASVAEEILYNAISAAVKDPRFAPIEADELDKLVISVDILGETEEIHAPDKLDVKRYGVIVTKGRKRGLLLPNLDGVDTVEEQIAIAKNKAGIRPEEEVRLERFEVIRHY